MGIALGFGTGMTILKAHNTITSFAWYKIGVQFLLLGCVAFVLSYFIAPEDLHFHTAFCVTGLIIVLVNLRKLRTANLGVVLTDHRIVFTLSFSLYFLMGASLLSLGSPELVEKTFNAYEVDANYALRIDAVNAAGFAIALLVSSMMKPRLLPRMADAIVPAFGRINLTKFTLLFFIAGAIITIYVAINDFSGEGQIISGVWRQMSKLLILGILLMAMYRGKREKLFWFGALVAAILSSTIGLLGFSRQELLLPIMAFLAGWSIRVNSLTVLLAAPLAALLLTSAVGGAVQYSRIGLYDVEKRTLSSRLDLIVAGLEAKKELDARSEYSVWNRLSYMHQQAAGMQLYDAGYGGDDITKILWVFVPRFIAPGKPIISQAGPDLYYKISGREGSAEAMGVFMDGYYNLGWAGLILWPVICGWIISQTSAIARRIVHRKINLLLPFTFMGLFIAFRTDGIMISDYLGVFMYIVYPIVAAWLFLQLSGGRAEYRAEDKSPALKMNATSSPPF